MSRVRNVLSRLLRRNHLALTEWSIPGTVRVREYDETRRPEFRERGYNQDRPFFPHQAYCLPKPGPDALRVAQSMCGIDNPARLWQMLVAADPQALSEFPAELFRDDEIVWHRQHFGMPGHIAYACLAVECDTLYVTTYVSDVVQRIGRRREYKTRIENRFRGWPHLVLNSVVHFAIERGAARVLSPTANWVMRHTDPARTVQRPLFERAYDRAVQSLFDAAPSRDGRWWVIDVAANGHRIVPPEIRQRSLGVSRAICVFHDVERGLGHVRSDPGLAARADRSAPAALTEMLRVERAAGARATYNVVGCLLPEVRAEIERGGHLLAFHSFDHSRKGRQLERCRSMDHRIAGYRPPQSRMTRELRDRNLCLNNIDWLATSVHELESRLPYLKNGVVRIPVGLDDYALYRGDMMYEEWERRALDLVTRNDFVALGLHDCYAAYWLPHYAQLLRKLGERGTLRTMNEVAWEVVLGAAE